ncbi:flagellin N-terminal helical domain-containing protein [Stutzerimonas azotifigens]|uniref:flagellin N-terminal helical domain-containing protein n=1 Tax=Stutzerimonas azotifigens TaxID=291995 RepID=UPI000424FC0E|nr:flagellin hook IN motif-containing protein [Stutzerimonas azotifigens]
MALTVNSNITSLNVQKNLNTAASKLGDSMERLSSGLKINSAKDDAAGLQISNRLTSQISGLNTAVKNANDGISIAQTAEGAMQESTNILQRMRELALQSANGSNSDEDRASLQQEFTALSGELTRIASTTSFGGKNLLDGSFGSTSFQIGANANQTVSFSLSGVAAKDLKGAYSIASSVGGAQKGMTASVTGSSIGAANGNSTDPVSLTGSTYTAPTANSSVNINGIGIALASGDDIDAAISAINDQKDYTGVTASKDNGKLVLTSSQSIEVANGSAIGFTSDSNSYAVAASGRASVTGTGFNAGGIVASTADTLTINATGYAATDITLQAGDELKDVVARINDKSSDSGVTASIEDGQLKLEAKGDITVDGNAAGAVGITGAGAIYEASTAGQAKVSGSVVSTSTFDATNGFTKANTSFKLNGTEISLLKGDSLSDVAARINDAGLDIKADATGGKLTFTSTSDISVDGDSAVLTDLGLTKGTTEVATAKNAEQVFAFIAPTDGDDQLTINGKTISLSEDESIDSVIDKINAAGSGVTAEKVSADGGNTYTSIKLSSADSFEIAQGDNGGFGVLGLSANNGGITRVAGAPASATDGKLSGDASIKLNGETITLKDGTDAQAIADKLNQSADKTGVTASVKDGRLELTSADGKAIELSNDTAGSLAKLGLTAGTTGAKLDSATSVTLNGTEVKLAAGSDMESIVTSINTASTGVTASVKDGALVLSSDKDFTVADGAAGTGLEALGLTTGSNTAVTQDTTVSNLDINTAEGAQTAIQVLDGAMQQIDSERAKLGAVQNRFDSTVSNLQNIAENASSARSRIQDVDFAAETAELAKQQTLQQASTSVLAQANQLPSSVLSLLQ